MRIIIKEFEDFTIDSVTVLLKKQAPKPISLYEIDPKYNFDDIVIISERDTKAKACNYKPAQLFTYEEIFSKIGNYILDTFNYKYDYYYLKKSLQKACTNKNIDTIITGSSYGIFGIDENLLSPNAVNLSMISQDLYYSIKLVYESFKYNKNIKKVVMICGYYYFFSDLSLSKTAGELLRISNIYLPLFDDIHNCTILPMSESYAKELHKDYKNIFYNVLNNANGVIHLIDTNCFQKDFFNDSDDFIDSDHLSDSGAKKLTELILSEIIL